MRDSALISLRRMTSVYPILDPTSLCEVAGSRVFAAIMHEKLDGSMLRCVYRTAVEICFYDGCLVGPSGRFTPRELSAHWGEVGTTIEGQFSAVRANLETPRLEVRVDFLGMGQVYYWTSVGRWLLSNSVELIARTIQSTDLDPVGMSLALSLGSVSGDRTLHRSVRVLPAAAHWHWEGVNNDPMKICDYPENRFWDRPRTFSFERSEAVQLEEKLDGICAELSKQRGVLECPITGGRDSRALVGLMIKGRISTRYYTDAFPGSEEDVSIGQQIAQRLNLPYQVASKDIERLSQEWSNMVERLVRQNDGMVSLWQIGDVLWTPRPEGSPSIRLWGIGGEIARGHYDNPIWHYGLKTASFAKRFLSGKLLERSALITHESVAIAAKFLEQWVDQKLDEGCPIADILDVFYTFERVRRWAASNARKVRPWVDVFSPFCTRPFVEAAFGLAPSLRFSEPIHYQLLRLNPELHRVPFSTEPWRSQNSNLGMLHMIWRKKIRRAHPSRNMGISYQTLLLERNLKEVRDFCRSRHNSCVWNYVRRPQFESLLDINTPSETRQKQLPLMLQILTLLYYEQLLNRHIMS
ncbi:MAG: hypothetical protein ABI167_04220 [Nitrosospira sp.]